MSQLTCYPWTTTAALCKMTGSGGAYFFNYRTKLNASRRPLPRLELPTTHRSTTLQQTGPAPPGVFMAQLWQSSSLISTTAQPVQSPWLWHP
jgi:hypothetical protein